MTSDAIAAPSATAPAATSPACRRIAEHRPRVRLAGERREADPARHVLDGRRPDDDRVAARARIRDAVAQQAVGDARADVQEHETRKARPAPSSASARPAVRTSLSTTIGPVAAKASGDVEVAPVERLRAPRPPLLIDELAQPQPDRRTLGRHDRGSRSARRERRRPIALRRRHHVPHEHLAGREIAQPGGDLRAADVDPDGEPLHGR